MPKKKSHKKRFAAPKFVQNADELQNRNNEMASQQAARRGRAVFIFFGVYFVQKGKSIETDDGTKTKQQ